MSFFVNNVELNEATFNQQEVKSIYFNTHLIWEAASWPGWDNATWGDVYNLCKAKKEERITAWPNDVVLGATKETTLSTAILGTSTFTMRIIGLDIDGKGVITFDSKYVTAESMNLDLIDIDTCQYDFYRYCDANDYIKPLNKGISSGDINRNGNVNYTYYEVWSLSEREVDLDRYSGISAANSTPTNAECTYGVKKPYPYFTSDGRRIKTIAGSSAKQSWLTRSVNIIPNIGMKRIAIDNNGHSAYDATNIRFSPCFAIGPIH